MKTLKRILVSGGILAALLTPSIGLGAAPADSTVGVGGYDLVSYRTGKKPLRGNGNHVAVRDGVTYLFATDANRKAFEATPDKYLPAYGGWCAYGVSVGKKFVGDPDVWKIVDDKLYLNLDTGIQEKWLEDTSGNIQSANAKWPRIRDRDPSDL